ncbi:MAG: hypothetical protein JST83_15570 [Bacteroidetes bacterium]|nr:hypothetical protein [Bacteroidota bacterium]
MKTPTWAYIVGILMMLLGGCNTLKNIQLVLTPTIMENQKAMMKSFTSTASAKADTVRESHGDSSVIVIQKTQSPFANKEMSQTMEKIFFMSDFQKKWVVRLGCIGFIPALIYILAGLFFVMRKWFAVKVAYLALVLATCFSIARTLILSHDASTGFLAMSAEFGTLFGIMIDVILLIVIIASDKSAYRKAEVSTY